MKIPADSWRPAISDEEQVTPATNPVNRIITMLRNTGLGAVLRIAVPDGDASQMLTTIERIAVTGIWAVTVTSTLIIAISAPLPAAAVFAVIAIELVGFVITLLATRWRRRKKELPPRLPAGEGLAPRPLAARGHMQQAAATGCFF